jgi:hypothetical protein
MMSNRKGQEGGGAAAILIALIALFILVYLLFIPPNVRLDILEGDGTSEDSDETSADSQVILLESPGTLTEEGSNSMSHNMASLNLYTKKEGKVLENVGGVAVARSDFSATLKNVPFTIEDLANTENVLLSFNIVTAEGNLILRLNGEEIFNKPVSGSVEPILLRKSLLKESNILEFDVTRPGIYFWSKNDYELTNVVLRADVTDTKHKSAVTSFYVDADEKSSLRKGELYFFPYCGSDADTMTVKLNGAVVFNGLPNCGYSNTFELSPEQIRIGSNDVEFSILKGTYTITKLKYDSELLRKKNKIYHFEVSKDEYYNSTHGYDVYVELKFPEDYSNREGRIYINNNIKSFDTDDYVYQAKITGFITEGYNSLRIAPVGSFDVTQIKVWLKK